MAVSFSACAAQATRDGYLPVGSTALYYEEAGSGAELVFLHGGETDRRIWDHHFEQFADEYRVVRYDVRGYGLTVDTGEEFAAHEDLLVLLQQLGLKRPVLIGLSLGGRIAIDFALAYPGRARALILLGPGLTGWPWSEEDHAFLQAIRAAAAAGDEERTARLWLASPYMAPAMERTESASRLRLLARENASAWARQSVERRLDPPAFGRVGEIEIPVMLLLGERDMPDIHGIVDHLQLELPQAERVDFTGVGHLVNLEVPEHVERELRRFLQQLP